VTDPQQRDAGRSTVAAPTVSSIIPCRNEARFIDRCLASVFSADGVAGEAEVIVVDGMSDDGTRVSPRGLAAAAS
jgi:cellulose synthase/poly-beta-1,6-N-acetylglucosamine synthase-like glycosyltransferase